MSLHVTQCDAKLEAVHPVKLKEDHRVKVLMVDRWQRAKQKQDQDADKQGCKLKECAYSYEDEW